MNIVETAKELGVSTKTFRNHIKNGIIEARLVDGKTGKELNIEPSGLEAFKKNKESGVLWCQELLHGRLGSKARDIF